MSSTLLSRLIFLVVVGAALWLRIRDLDVRSMHADEANQAVKLGELIENGHYAFDPHDHHGPTLYYAALPIAWLRGEKTLAALNETTVRLVPALAGTLAVILLFALVAPLGTMPAFIAAGLLAVSPPTVYYSRYFIQETLLVTFTLAALVCAQRWWRQGNLRWAILAGACAGLMQATKASAPIFVVAACVALIAARAQRPIAQKPLRDLGLALVAAAFVAALFYSSFGLNPGGLRDAFAVYGNSWSRAATGAGHEKPWWYYLQLFWRQTNGGLVFQQIAFSILALVGAILAVTRDGKFYRWAAVYTLIVAVVLSLTPYKTPWHVIHLVPGMAILAARAIVGLPRPWLIGLASALAIMIQLDLTRLVAFDRAADARNPYAYVHSSPDVLKFRPLVEAALASSPQGVVRIIGEEYWPIPWYLRGLPRVGYWSAPPEDCEGALVVATGEQSAAVRERLHGNYRESYLGLRPGVLCVVFTPQP